jgi:hypothetical protein
MRCRARSPWFLVCSLLWVGCGGAPAPKGQEPDPGAGGEGGTASPADAGRGGTGGAGGGDGGSGGRAGLTADAAVAVSDATPDAGGAAGGDAAAAEASAPSGLVKIFDGTSFEGWVYNPNAWTLREGAMVGKVSSGQSQAFTKQDYSNFRLIVWSRMVNGNDHLGICLWGGRPAAGRYGFERCLLVIPPNGAIWDYLTNTDNPKPDYQKGMAEWHKTEILANRMTGRVLVAVNGKLVHDYQDPPGKLSRRQHGPIGVQIHKAGTESEYKDIEIEVDPKSDNLLTVP